MACKHYLPTFTTTFGIDRGKRTVFLTQWSVNAGYSYVPTVHGIDGVKYGEGVHDWTHLISARIYIKGHTIIKRKHNRKVLTAPKQQRCTMSRLGSDILRRGVLESYCLTRCIYLTKSLRSQFKTKLLGTADTCNMVSGELQIIGIKAP